MSTKPTDSASIFQKDCQVHPILWKPTFRYLQDHQKERQDILYKVAGGKTHLMFEHGRPAIIKCRKIGKETTKYSGIERVLFIGTLSADGDDIINVTFGAVTDEEDFLEEFLGELVEEDVSYQEARDNYLFSATAKAHEFLTTKALKAPRSVIRHTINQFVGNACLQYFPENQWFAWIFGVTISDVVIAAPLLRRLRQHVTNPIWAAVLKRFCPQRIGRSGSTAGRSRRTSSCMPNDKQD